VAEDSPKLDKAVVLYMPASVLGAKVGAHCGDCWKFFGNEGGTGSCIEVAGPINPARGVCGLYVGGRVFDGRKPNLPVPVVQVSKEIAGYVEQGPTHCGNCDEKLGGESLRSECKKVAGEIEYYGCCNRWEERDGNRQNEFRRNRAALRSMS
jgi:hypothetical protein